MDTFRAEEFEEKNLIFKRSPSILNLAQFISENQYLFTRNIVFSGEIDEVTVKDATEKILLLEHLDPKKPITLIIDSYGGDVYDSLFVVDFMATRKCEIYTVAMGKAMSAAFAIMVAGKKGKRFVTPHTTMMNHEISSEAMGKTSDMKIEVEECERLEQLWFDFLSKRTKCPKTILERMKKKDVYFSAESCLKYGFADAMIKNPRIVAPTRTQKSTKKKVKRSKSTSK